MLSSLNRAVKVGCQACQTHKILSQNFCHISRKDFRFFLRNFASSSECQEFQDSFQVILIEVLFSDITRIEDLSGTSVHLAEGDYRHLVLIDPPCS